MTVAELIADLQTVPNPETAQVEGVVQGRNYNEHDARVVIDSLWTCTIKGTAVLDLAHPSEEE